MRIRLLAASLLLSVSLSIGGSFTISPIHAATIRDTVVGNEEYRKVTGQQGVNVPYEHPALLVQRVIEVALGFLGIVMVCLLLFAGYKYMTAEGDDDDVEEAQGMIKYAIIGMLIILASWGLTRWVIATIVDTVRGVV